VCGLGVLAVDAAGDVAQAGLSVESGVVREILVVELAVEVGHGGVGGLVFGS
jgi:hypothetical protein